MIRRSFLAMAALAGLAACAQTPPPPPTVAAAPPPPPPPMRVRGTIEAVTGSMLTVKARDGQDLNITLKDPLTVMTVRRLRLSAIEPNSYIGTATRVAADGKQTALEVLVFPDSMRGAGEGHYPWDLESGSMMTNGTVKGAMKAAHGRELTITYKDSSTTVYVPPNAPIVTFAPATRADLRPGAKVFVVAAKAPDGTLSAARVTVGTHGVVPPM